MKTLNRKGGASDEVIAHFLQIKLIHHISSMHIHESMYKTYLEYNGKFFANIFFSRMQRATSAFNLVERKINKLPKNDARYLS